MEVSLNELGRRCRLDVVWQWNQDSDGANKKRKEWILTGRKGPWQIHSISPYTDGDSSIPAIVRVGISNVAVLPCASLDELTGLVKTRMNA